MSGQFPKCSKGSAALPFATHAGIVCGDGVVSTDPNIFQECDEVDNATAPASSLCSNTQDLGSGPCIFTRCGDNIIQSPNGVGFDEDCDDGGASATCSEICETITTTTTTTTTTTAAPTTTTTTTLSGGNVMIDGCDTGVESVRLQAAVSACEAKFSNNLGKFVSCVSKKTNKLRRDREIRGKDKGRINSCAAGSSIGN